MQKKAQRNGIQNRERGRGYAYKPSLKGKCVRRRSNQWNVYAIDL